MTKSRVFQLIFLVLVFGAGILFWGSSSSSSNDTTTVDSGPSPTP